MFLRTFDNFSHKRGRSVLWCEFLTLYFANKKVLLPFCLKLTLVDFVEMISLRECLCNQDFLMKVRQICWKNCWRHPFHISLYIAHYFDPIAFHAVSPWRIWSAVRLATTSAGLECHHSFLWRYGKEMIGVGKLETLILVYFWFIDQFYGDYYILWTCFLPHRPNLCYE